MIRVKRKVNKKIIISLFLLLAFAILLTSSILLGLIEQDSGSTSNKRELLEVLDGEAIYNGYNVAYPFVSDGSIQHISVYDKSNSFKLIRPDEKGDMVLYYKDRTGATTPYYPSIFGTDENIAYSSLYSIDQSDGLGMVPMVSYLCSAVGFTAFQDRIELSDDPEVRAAQLDSFGFSQDKIVTVQVTYNLPANEGEKVESESHTVKIGKKNVSGAGRYFMVDDRNYIYCASTNYLDYGVQSFIAFIKPYLVTEGMSGDDSILAAYLTEDFRQWNNTIHKDLGDVVVEDAQVITMAQAITPRVPGSSFNAAAGDDDDGYRYGYFEKTPFYLQNLKNDSYSRVVAALVGAQVGEYYDYKNSDADADNALIFTLISQSKNVDFSKKSSVTYEYKIVAIESILTADSEITEEGTRVGKNTLLKVTYETKVDGVAIASFYEHAVIDLSDERIPEKARKSLSNASVGALTKPVSFSYEYNTDSAVRYDVEYVICDVLEIYDKDGKAIEEVAADSQVIYRYYLVADGVRDEDVHVGTLTSVDPDDEDTKKIRAALLGNKITYDTEIPVMTYTEYSELLYDFLTYKVASIEYFVTSELITAFGFVNASDRNPFFGESFYQNKLGDENQLYGINADVCIEVVKYFMGVANSSSSGTSADGLVGKETVAIGITPENMEKYGLYAHTLYIELPRGIYPIQDENYDDENALDNYAWRDTLSFYLFVSDEQPDGSRYIASDMYDLVATIDGDMFDFLEYDFAEFWARRNLIITDFKNIDNIKLELNMNDLFGKYNFDITHETVYVDENGIVYSEEQKDVYTDVYYLTHVDTSMYGDCSETGFSKFLEQAGLNKTSLNALYDYLYDAEDGKHVMGENDALGSSNFKNLIHLIYGIYYTGVIDDLTAEQRAEIAEGTPTARLDVSLDSRAYNYTFEFFKLDDRRVMVSLHESDSEGNKVGGGVSDFYISTFAFKKIVNGFVDVLNGNIVDSEIGYSKNG